MHTETAHGSGGWMPGPRCERPATGVGALNGVRLGVKDLIDIAGAVTGGGNPDWATSHPPAVHDAPCVATLRGAGARVVGKTISDELAFSLEGENAHYGAPRHPRDPDRLPGGSSSGSAAAVAWAEVDLALGTDTGGSVRIPCAFNGCASLRPSMGRYPQQGIAPISHTRDTAGPMALSVADLVLLDRAIAGGAAVRPADLKRVRLGVVPAFFANLDADTRAATDAALAKLRAAGVTLVELEMPKLAELNGAVGFPVALYEANDDMAAYLAKYDTGIDLKQLAAGIASPDVKGTFDGLVLPRKLPAANGTVDARPAYDNAMRVARPALQKLYRDTFTKHRLDALVFPTVPQVALLAAPEASSPENFGALIQNTDPGSNAGIPGLQLPSALGATSGLPIGLE
ncbi:amidase family protein, partial [Variovorax sp. CT11-76]